MAWFPAHHRWIAAIQGIFAIIFGVIAIFLPGTALRALALVFGIYAIADGVIALFSLPRAPSASYGPRWTRAFQGIIGIIFGIAALVWFPLTVLTLVYLIAIWAIIVGALRILGAIALHRGIERRWLLVVSGAVALLFGLAVLIRPTAGLSALMTVIGFFAVLYGIVLIGLAAQAAREGRGGRPAPGGPASV
jgi:uncharacterized membrane protein HdeD (DUF308 family)